MHQHTLTYILRVGYRAMDARVNSFMLDRFKEARLMQWFNVKRLKRRV